MGKYSVLFLILQLLKITQVETFTKPCNASLLTVSIVTRCPTDEASYNISARQKNCSSLVDSSSCESFEYHCVLSEDLNSAIEVCAPSFFIIGHACAMFSTTLQSIMRVDNMTCGNDTAGCPFSYHSTTSYKYRLCIPTEKQIYTTEATKRNSVVIVIVVVILIIGSTATVLVLIYFMRRSRRRRAPEANPVNQNLPQPRGENELQDDDIELDNPEAQQLLDATAEPELERLTIVKETVADQVDVTPEDGDDSNLQVMAKIEVDTTEKNKRVMLKCSMNILTKSLVNPDETWTKDKIKQHVKGIINDLEDAKETDLLIEFIRTIDQDPNIQTTLIKCGVEMFELISSVQQRYNATKVQIINGCVCFVFSFADENNMEKLLNDFSERGKHFRNCISKILFNQTYLGIFQIHPKTVTWKACELKVYKEAKEVEDIKPEKPIAGTLKDMLEEEEEGAEEVEDIKPKKPIAGTLKDKLEEQEVKLPVPPARGHKDTEDVDEIALAIENIFTQIYKDILEMEVPYATVVTKVKSSDIYETLSQEENDVLNKAVKFGYDELKIPLIYKLLRNVCSTVPQPTKGLSQSSMPSAEDIAVGDDIERIKHFQIQEFGTISKPMSQKFFDEYWESIFAICRRMQTYTDKNYLKDLEKIRSLLFNEMENEVRSFTQKMQKEVLTLTPEMQSGKIDEMQHQLRGISKEEGLEDKREKILDDFQVKPNKFPAYNLVRTRELSFKDCEDTSLNERASEFAMDGFFYRGYARVTACFHCGIHKGDWKQEDNIHEEHKNLSKETRCDFIEYVQLHILKAK